MFDNFISTVIQRVPCLVHDKGIDRPCWILKQSKTRKISFAVCDARARAAGMVGEISDKSLRRNIYKKQEKEA